MLSRALLLLRATFSINMQRNPSKQHQMGPVHFRRSWGPVQTRLPHMRELNDALISPQSHKRSADFPLTVLTLSQSPASVDAAEWVSSGLGCTGCTGCTALSPEPQWMKGTQSQLHWHLRHWPTCGFSRSGVSFGQHTESKIYLYKSDIPKSMCCFVSYLEKASISSPSTYFLTNPLKCLKVMPTKFKIE